jgi:hypothetical protein
MVMAVIEVVVRALLFGLVGIGHVPALRPSRTSPNWSLFRNTIQQRRSLVFRWRRHDSATQRL